MLEIRNITLIPSFFWDQMQNTTQGFEAIFGLVAIVRIAAHFPQFAQYQYIKASAVILTYCWCSACSQRGRGRSTCSTWRAWSTRGRPVWSSPIRPTRAAPSSARNISRRSWEVRRRSLDWRVKQTHSSLSSPLLLLCPSGLQTLRSHSGRWDLQWHGEFDFTQPTHLRLRPSGGSRAGANHCRGKLIGV